MSEFYAVYLFLVACIILLCIGLWKRIWVFFMFSGIAGIFAGLYFMFWSPTTSTFVDFLGIFCILGGVVIFLAMFFVIPRKKEEEQPEEKPYRAKLRERIDKTSDLYKRTHRKRWDED